MEQVSTRRTISDSGRSSLICLATTLVIFLLGGLMKLYMAVTPAGGSGEFQAMNHLCPYLILCLICIPGVLLAATLGSVFAVIDQFKGRSRAVMTGGIAQALVVAIWLIVMVPLLMVDA